MARCLKRGTTAVEIDFPGLPWEKVEGGGAKGRMKRMFTRSGDAVRLLEMDPRWNEADWCRNRHVGYVISGTLKLSFPTGRPMKVRAGRGFSIPTGCEHKASCDSKTTLFVLG